MHIVYIFCEYDSSCCFLWKKSLTSDISSIGDRRWFRHFNSMQTKLYKFYFPHFLHDSSVGCRKALLLKGAITETCDIWDIDFNSDNWELEFMAVFGTRQLKVTVDRIRNSCDVSI